MMTCVFAQRVGVRCAYLKYLYMICHLSRYISAWVFYAGVRCAHLDTRDMTYLKWHIYMYIYGYIYVHTCIKIHVCLCKVCIRVCCRCVGLVYRFSVYEYVLRCVLELTGVAGGFAYEQVIFSSTECALDKSCHTYEWVTATHYCNTLLQQTALQATLQSNTHAIINVRGTFKVYLRVDIFPSIFFFISKILGRRLFGQTHMSSSMCCRLFWGLSEGQQHFFPLLMILGRRLIGGLFWCHHEHPREQWVTATHCNTQNYMTKL